MIDTKKMSVTVLFERKFRKFTQIKNTIWVDADIKFWNKINRITLDQ